jgi:CBS domain-containing protein
MNEKRNIGEICNRTTVFAYKQMSVAEAARLMLEQHVGSLVVVEQADGGREVVGMLTDRDITVGVVARDFNPQTSSVADIMSSNMVLCRTGESMADVLSLMRRHGVRRVPVTDEKNILVGIVTLDDLLEIVAEDLHSFVQVIDSERKRETRERG